MEAANAIRGCQDSITSTHSAGRAAGFSECVQWFESLAYAIKPTLSPGAGVQVPTQTQDEQPAEGEPELLERLSP